jgi:hypothetical protein
MEYFFIKLECKNIKKFYSTGFLLILKLSATNAIIYCNLFKYSSGNGGFSQVNKNFKKKLSLFF